MYVPSVNPVFSAHRSFCRAYYPPKACNNQLALIRESLPSEIKTHLSSQITTTVDVRPKHYREPPADRMLNNRNVTLRHGITGRCWAISLFYLGVIFISC